MLNDYDEESVENLSRFGKWSSPGVPHKDWYCVGEFDAKEVYGDLVTCEMCEKQQIRFVHIMEHRGYPVTLNCGCVCASHMSGDSKSAEIREQRMRTRASRRGNFPKRKGWKQSAKGNPHIKLDGVHIVIAQNRDGFFRIGTKLVWDDKFEWGRKGFATLEEAKLASFDEYERLTST